MRIKTHKNGNEYLLVSGGIWVRNYAKAAPPIDINNFTTQEDRHLLIENQLKNQAKELLQFDPASMFKPNICIISDGYDFENKQALLKSLPDDVLLIGTNRSLAKWDMKNGRAMGYYLVNNPYPECMAFMPSSHRYFPPCVASVRTYPEFMTLYRGQMFKYYPTFEEDFAQKASDRTYTLDDYRNPICAAISLAYKLRAVRILLFCCDDAFAGERPGAEQLANGLWMYPQHRTPHGLIEGSMYWFAHQPHKRVRIGHHSSGPDYAHVPYIPEEGLAAFFTTEL